MMEARDYHFYEEKDVINRGLGAFKTVKPEQSAAEKRGRLPYCGWRNFFELTLDPALPLNDAAGDEGAWFGRRACRRGQTAAQEQISQG